MAKTLNEFKAWLEKLYNFNTFKDAKSDGFIMPFNPVLAILEQVRDKLASVEDGLDSDHCVKCENCGGTFLCTPCFHILHAQNPSAQPDNFKQ